MKENKHIEKELLFKNNIKDITSISLDSDYKIEDGSIIGNFLITGEYKIHELSLNKEKFNFKIPFNHELGDDIDIDTVKLEINNFIYDYKKDELIVDIDYDLMGDRKDVLVFDNRESLDEFLQSKEVEVIDDRLEEFKENLDKEETNEEISLDNEDDIILEDDEVVLEEDLKSDPTDTLEEKEEKEKLSDAKEKALDDKLEGMDDCDDIVVDEKELDINIKDEREVINPDDIISKISDTNDGFVTYKVYKIKENETLESIVVKYHTSIDDLKEYNDLNNINVGDRLIIPKYE